MARPRKQPNYNSDKLSQELIAAVSERYMNPLPGEADSSGRMPLKDLAEEFCMTPMKVRKLLIMSGAYETETSVMVNELHQAGKSITEIQKIMGLGRSSVHGYLPYSKIIYNMDEQSLLAKRLRKYRKRKAAYENLRMGLMDKSMSDLKEEVWQVLLAFEDYPFMTERGLRFRYNIKGNEIFFSRKEKSVTKSTVDLALENAIALQREGKIISGPKQLQCFGASYLYPVFIRIGVIQK